MTGRKATPDHGLLDCGGVCAMHGGEWGATWPGRGTTQHENPCTHTDDPCVDGTHYCENLPCAMTDERWPCPFAVSPPARKATP